jgi:hypothetical protein
MRALLKSCSEQFMNRLSPDCLRGTPKLPGVVDGHVFKDGAGEKRESGVI